jgi:hypothetical protein
MENLPEVTFHIQELIAAIIFVITGGGLTTILAKNKGWITFGKPVERRGCHRAVKQVCDEHRELNGDVVELKQGQADLKKILKGLDSKVDRLVGYHLGKNGVDLG